MVPMVPMAPSWVISKNRNVVAKLVPDHANRRFDIEIHTGVSKAEMAAAEQGTVRDGNLVHGLNGRIYRTPIKTIRGDYRDAEGNTVNRLRRWEKHDFKPRQDDIFQERLYCIQWMKADTLGSHRPETFFAAITEEDLKRERKVEAIVAENFARWQENGVVPDMAIEPGYNTDQPIRERGWMCWHQLFTSRDLLVLSVWKMHADAPETLVFLSMAPNYAGKLCQWQTTSVRLATDGSGKQVGRW
jgi:putative DNA methylase